MSAGLPLSTSTILPLAIIARVSHIVSSKSIPWKQIAIAIADIWYSGSSPLVNPLTKKRISSSVSACPSRFFWMIWAGRSIPFEL